MGFGENCVKTDVNLQWVVFYSERGGMGEVILTTPHETEVRVFFFAFVSQQQHWHLVGAFATPLEAAQ